MLDERAWDEWLFDEGSWDNGTWDKGLWDEVTLDGRCGMRGRSRWLKGCGSYNEATRLRCCAMGGVE